MILILSTIINFVFLVYFLYYTIDNHTRLSQLEIIINKPNTVREDLILCLDDYDKRISNLEMNMELYKSIKKD